MSKENQNQSLLITPAAITCPPVPNFVRTNKGQWIDVGRLDDDALAEIAQMWLDRLKERAKERREEK